MSAPYSSETSRGAYETTHPASGIQDLRHGEAQPHGSGRVASGLSNEHEFGSAAVSGRETYGGLNDPSLSSHHASFPQSGESDTLTSGELGKYGSESQARRSDLPILGAASGYEGVTSGGFVASQLNESVPSSATTAGMNSEGLNGGGLISGAGASAGNTNSNNYYSSSTQYSTAPSNTTSSYTGGASEFQDSRQYQDNSRITSPSVTSGGKDIAGTPHDDKIGNPKREQDLTIGGFNPKSSGANDHVGDINSTPAAPKEVERMSTDGPHGLVFHNGKYVHRREIDGTPADKVI